ncbi:hypothetical protein NQ318_004117 [Aromia moschata]|uniref:Enamelin n=1 Tax=Aromia moschata TaxID=1265417 RepID=A0AAV8XIP2_9CUCU|nr:hypothetical protein NQ318_004117 [Aromia moschata]
MYHFPQNQWQNQQGHDNWYSQPHQQYQPVPKQEPHSQPQQQNYWQESYNPQVMGYNQSLQHQQYGHGQQYQNQTGYYQNNSGYDSRQTYGNLQYNQQYNQNNAAPRQPTDGASERGGLMELGVGGMKIIRIVSNVGDAFSNEESWNWGLEDTKSNADPIQNPPKKDEPDVNELFPKVGKNATRPVKTENNPDSVKPLPQDLLKMSQESSDDILHTSESDKSHMMSRSSTISHSPLSGQEPSSSHNLEEATIKNEASYDDLASNHQRAAPVKLTPTPPPPKNTQTPPLMPPPQGSLDDLKNPYKRSTGLSHKAANKFRASNTTPPDNRQFQSSFHSQQVNLETLPDNSEQPDPMPSQPVQKHKPVAQWPDNNEAPINDRNQYLETGQLSGAALQDYNIGGGHGPQAGR